MPANIITIEDLENFRLSLLTDLQNTLSQNQFVPTRKWLKSHQVRKLLTLSPGTLQNLRVNGTLPFAKIGGVIFYDYEDIKKMIEDRKHNPHLIGTARGHKKSR